jgi:predicted PurR-regulated permease PerM
MSDKKSPIVPPPEVPIKVESWQRKHLWDFQPVRDICFVAAILGLVYGGYVLGIVTVPLLVALGFSYLVEPFIVRVTKVLPWSRRFIVVALLTLFVVVVSVSVAVIVPVVATQAQQLKNNAPKYVSSLRHLIAESKVPEWMKGTVHSVLDILPSAEEQNADKAAANPAKIEIELPSPILKPNNALTEERVREIIKDELARQAVAPINGELSGYASKGLQALALLAHIAGSFAQLVFFVGISGICFFYFSGSFPKIQAYARSLLPVSNRSRILSLVGKMDTAISGFVRGRLLISFILTLLYIAGWKIAGIPHAVLLGMFAGVCSLVPYLAWSSLPIAWILLAVSLAGEQERTGFYFATIEGSGVIVWWKVLFFPLTVLICAQLVEDYALTPTIQGQATNLHPLTISLAVIAGGSLAGLYGMLLAIPSAACIKIVLNEVIMPKMRAWLEA